MRIVCVSGKAQHGKDTSAEFLKSYLTTQGKRVLICHYGDLVKYVCRQFFDWDGEKDEAGRHLLQYVGTDVVRNSSEDFWAIFLAQILAFFEANWDYVLIPDCRFRNEIDVMTNWFQNVTHLRIIREGFVSPLTPEQQEHISETALDDYEPDCRIYNNGSLSDLQALICLYAKNVLLDSEEQEG